MAEVLEQGGHYRDYAHFAHTVHYHMADWRAWVNQLIGGLTVLASALVPRSAGVEEALRGGAGPRCRTRAERRQARQFRLCDQRTDGLRRQSTRVAAGPSGPRRELNEVRGGRERASARGSHGARSARPSNPSARGSTVSQPTHGERRGDGYSGGVRLAVGDVVVYPAHGVGRVAAREKQLGLGTAQEILVLELADGLSVTLPVERARELLRPLLSEVDLRRVQETLRKEHTLSEDVWLKRRKDTQVKLAGGDPLGLAEVVRDCARRQKRLIAKRTGSQLSPSERDLYTRARRLLSGEIGLARGLEQAEADAWIEEQLAAPA